MRIFIGLELSETVQRLLTAYSRPINVGGAKFRCIPGDSLHMTIKFLGEIPEDSLGDLETALARAAVGHSPFSFKLGECGCFPERGPARIIWAGVSSGEEELVRLAGSTEESFARFSAKREAGFVPHITLCRVKEDRSHGQLRRMVGARKLPPETQLVDSLTLFTSVERDDRRFYEVVSRARLGHP